jgi:hypothetical protein
MADTAGIAFGVKVDNEKVRALIAAFASVPGALNAVVRNLTAKARENVRAYSPAGVVYVPRTRRRGKKAKKYVSSYVGMQRQKKRGEKERIPLKDSWSAVAQADELAFTFGTAKPYAPILELGLYPGTTPPRLARQPGYGIRTVAATGGIYSTQAVGGIIGPWLQKANLDRMVEGEVNLLMRTLEKYR